MPGPIANDLRYRLLAAWHGGEGSMRELAERFQVSAAWARKVRQQQRRTGRVERVPQVRHGFASRVDEAALAQLGEWVREQPDRTAWELRELLRQQRQIEVSQGRVGQLLRGLGLRRKKNAARGRA
jgi:transposase